MYLRAASEEDRSTWMEKLEEVMPKHVIPPFKGKLEKQVRPERKGGGDSVGQSSR